MPFKYTSISEYQKSSFSAATTKSIVIQHDVYRLGNGPPIIIIQELPGISKETLRLADKLRDAGFLTILPHLFGPLERTSVVGNTIRLFCMYREFHMFQSKRSSPIVDWLKELCRKEKQDNNVEGVGVIGMCLTGNFAISLMGDQHVLASVSSQPSLPFFQQGALHMSEQEVGQIKSRIDDTAPMKAFRFEKDIICCSKKFEVIQKTFNQDGNERIELTTIPGKGHSVFTGHFVDEEGHPTYNALQSVIGYFGEQLKKRH